MKSVKYLSIAVMAFCLASCSGKKDSGENEENVFTIEIASDGEGSYSSSSSGSQDWDAILDSYEQYVDKYISCLKKAAKGDMSALSEYPALMEKAQEFSSEMEDAQSDMSSSQWARYMEITNKMAQAAANIQ